MTKSTTIINLSHNNICKAAEHADLNQLIEEITLKQPSTKDVNNIAIKITDIKNKNSELNILITIKTYEPSTLEDTVSLNIKDTIEKLINITNKKAQDNQSNTITGTINTITSTINTITNNIGIAASLLIPQLNQINQNLDTLKSQLKQNFDTLKHCNINKTHLKTLSQLQTTLQKNNVTFQIIPLTNEDDMENQDSTLLNIAGLTILTVAVGAIIYAYFKNKNNSTVTLGALHTKNKPHLNASHEKTFQYQALFISSCPGDIDLPEIEKDIKRNGPSALNQIKQCTHVSHTDTHLNFDEDKDKGDPEFLLIVVKDPQRKTEGLAEGIFDSQTDEYIRTEGYKSAEAHLVSADFINNPALKIKLRKS